MSVTVTAAADNPGGWVSHLLSVGYSPNGSLDRKTERDTPVLSGKSASALRADCEDTTATTVI